MRIAAFLLPIAATITACQPSQRMTADWSAMQQTRTAQLAAAGERWRIAYNAGDWDTLRTLYTDDAVLMPQGSPKSQGADKIIAFLQRLSEAGGSAVLQFDNEEVIVERNFGPSDIGFVTAKYRMDIVIPGSAPRVIAGRSLLVYKWQDGEWKLWRDMDNFTPEITPSDFPAGDAE